MSKSIYIQDGILTLAESKAICPYCKHSIPFTEIEAKHRETDNGYMRFKCKCKRFIGISTNFQGDFVAFELNQKVQWQNETK